MAENHGRKLQKIMENYGKLWKIIENYGKLWIIMEIYQNLSKFIEIICGNLWKFITINFMQRIVI